MKPMQILNTVLLAMVLVVASAGGAYYYFQQSGSGVAEAASPAPASPVVLPNPIFLPLDPFTVTLNGGHSQILYLEITLRLTDTASQRMLNDYMPEVRNRVLTELSRYSPSQVQTTEGRAQLAESLRQTLSQAYQPQPNGPLISNVLFTAFVIQ